MFSNPTKVIEGDFSCECPIGFSGKSCEYDSCSFSPCLNGGRCFPDGENFTCVCFPGFSGTECELNPCSAENVCKNKGTCHVVKTNDKAFPKCSCQAGFDGEFCEKTPCFEKPCQNEGKCSLDENLNVQCDCDEGFSGKFCEIDPCSDSPCENDGKCMVYR